MSFDSSTIEADLRRLNAAPLDGLLLDRLESCIDETWMQLSPAEIAMEHQLRAGVPARLPDSLSASLEAILQSVSYPMDDKIVTFPKSAAAPARGRGDHGSRWWGAAAAVALTGAVTALLMPVKPQQTAEDVPNRIRHTTAADPVRGELIPAGFNSGLSEAVDQGVIWQPDQQPHRVLKVVYKDCVTLKDANGGTYQVERPRVEYILVPADTN